jgi:alkylated DNA repair dioxygenase AlkB
MAASSPAVRMAMAAPTRPGLRDFVAGPDLFAAPASPLVLIDDAQGGFRYWPGFVDPDTAQAWFEALRDGVAWESLQRPMYDRVVDVPRLLATFRIAEIPDRLPLRTMLDRVRALAPAPYNAVGLNLYRDGRDSVAMHNDKLHSLSAGHPIALVSLGAPRRMLIRAKAGARETVAIELAPGSLLRMSHAAQFTHEHGIPKTKRAVGPRMSVVFRVRPDAASPYGGMRPG